MSGKSRIEKILENLLGENNVIEPPIGRDEKILYSILNDLEYTDPPHSIFEDLLLAIKNGSSTETEYAYENLVRDEKILFCKLNRREYFEPPHSRLERLLIKWLYLDLYLNIDGVPPFTFVSNGSPIIDYTIYGNTVQSGTPTPDNPIMPDGCGDMTENLWNNLGFSANTISTAGVHSLSNTYGTSLSTVSGGSVDITQEASSGTTSYQNGYFFIEIDISQFSLGDNIVISFDYEITNKLSSTSTTVAYVGQGATGSNVIGNWGENGRAIIKATITSAMTRPYVEIRLCGNSIKVRNVQICLGSTALPYEPWGYKIPISSANTTTPVYLGEVETTRQVRKLVLTGEEANWYYYENATSTVKFFYLVITRTVGVNLNNLLNTHGFKMVEVTQQSGNILIRIYAVSEGMGTVEEWKTCLAQQYANGTPVTVWYVLAEPESGIVNEPLMKIGDYADSISYEQTVVSIPTVSGRNTFDVLGDVKPSNVELTYAPRAPLLRTRKTVLKK